MIDYFMSEILNYHSIGVKPSVSWKMLLPFVMKASCTL